MIYVRLAVLALAALGFAAWGDTAQAKPKPGHHPPGHAKRGGHSKEWRGGPPPWAPAHGYRRQRFEYRHHGRMESIDPDTLVYLPESGFARCDREKLGEVLGGIVGGAAGSTIGKGDGRTLATLGGTILGVLIGGNIGRTLDQTDQNCIGQSLERAPVNREVVWRNPDRGSVYKVTPREIYQQPDGQYCREYTMDVVIDGRVQTTHGRACRRSDGTWAPAR